MSDIIPAEASAHGQSASAEPPSESSLSDAPPPAQSEAIDAMVDSVRDSSGPTASDLHEPGAAATQPTTAPLEATGNAHSQSSSSASVRVASKPTADPTIGESAPVAAALTPASQPTPPPTQAPSSLSSSASSPSSAPYPSPPSATSSPSIPSADAKAAPVSSPPASAAASSPSLSKDPASPPPKPRCTPPTAASTPTSSPPSSDPLSSPVRTARPPPAPVQSPPLSAAKAPTKSPVTKPAPPRVTPVKTSLPASAATSAAATPVPPSPVLPLSIPPAYPLPSNVQLALLAKTQGQTDAYGNTTRCVCAENDNSDGFMLSCDTCIAEGTPVALRYGLAAPIEAVTERGREVLAVKEDELGAITKSVLERGAVGSNVKGERAVCRMWLANGRYLDLTDDHPVFVRGKRGEAPVSRPVKELKTGCRHALHVSGSERVDEGEVAMAMMGVDAAVDDSRLDVEDDRSWSLSLADSGLLPLSFCTLPLPLPPSAPHHLGTSHRDRALAFARVLGYVTGRGRRRLCVDSRQPSLCVAFKHWLDVDEWVKDVNLVMSTVTPSPCKHTIRAGRSGRWWITLPAQLSTAMFRLIGSHELCGMLASPIFDSTSTRPPAAFVREYVAALFGALGKPMRCKRSIGHDAGLDLHCAVTLTIAPHKPTSASNSAPLLSTHISSLLSSLGIHRSQQRTTHCSRPRQRSRGSTGTTTARSLDKSHQLLHVTCPITFSRLVSYRYAAVKQLRLSVGCAYLHYCNNIRQQRLSYPTLLSASHSSAFVSSRWTKHIESTMPALHCSSSQSSPLSLPTFARFLEVIGLPSLFSGSFSLSSTAASLPAYFLPIVSVQPLPSPLPVYDLSMRAGQSPSFLAACVFVHNCEVWQHGDCLQVNERSVPEQYFCIAEGTLVTLADGTSVAIEDVQAGDDVLSYHAALTSTETEGLTVRRVDAVFSRGRRSCVELLFSDGRALVCTPDHRIRTADGRWVEAGKLVVGADEVAVGVEYPRSTARGWKDVRQVGQGEEEDDMDGEQGNGGNGGSGGAWVYPSVDKVTYGVHRDARNLPLFRVRLVGRRDVGEKRVHDLSVPNPQGDDSRSFTANGVVVHNCEICMPDHPIHAHNDSVRKSAINKRSKGKGKGTKLAGLGSPQVDSRKSLEAKKQQKDVKAVEGKKEPVKAAAEKEKPKALQGAPVAAGAEAVKKKKTKRDDEAAVVGVAERRDGRDQQPAAKKARVDERAPTAATGKDKEEKQPAPTVAGDSTPSLTASASAGELSELGSDGMDAREKKKLKKLLETIQKMEDQNVKRRKIETKKPEGDSLTSEGKERDDTHVAVAAVHDDRAGARAADDDSAMDTSSPTSPNMSTARSVRAKLRAEREETEPLPGQPLQGDLSSLGGSSAALNASAAGARKKKGKAAAGSDSEEDTSDVVDFVFRRRRWQDVKRISGSEMGPFYLGKKEWLLSGWRREKERQVTGWDDRVKEEELGVVKRAIDNWREEKKEREDEARAKELGTGTRRRMLVQRAVDGVPTISKFEVVGSAHVAEADTNGDRKRRLDDDEPDTEHSSPLFVSTKSNGTTHTSTSSAAASPPSAAAAAASSAVSRPSIPKVSRGMLNGLGGKGGVGPGAPGRLNNNRQSSGTVGGAQH